jgi:hypothetical protein
MPGQSLDIYDIWLTAAQLSYTTPADPRTTVLSLKR